MDGDLFWDLPGHGPSMRSAATGSVGDTGDGIRIHRNQHQVQELESRVDRLSMICCAMWTIIQANTDSTDKDLLRLVEELDLCDGTLDGKANVEQVSKCATCERPVAIRHLRCIYCGTPRVKSNPFEDVL